MSRSFKNIFVVLLGLLLVFSCTKRNKQGARQGGGKQGASSQKAEKRKKPKKDATNGKKDKKAGQSSKKKDASGSGNAEKDASGTSSGNNKSGTDNGGGAGGNSGGAGNAGGTGSGSGNGGGNAGGAGAGNAGGAGGAGGNVGDGASGANGAGAGTESKSGGTKINEKLYRRWEGTQPGDKALPPELKKVYAQTVNELRSQINAKSVEFSETGKVSKKNGDDYSVSGRCAVRDEGRVWLYVFHAEVTCFGHAFWVRDVKYEQK